MEEDILIPTTVYAARVKDRELLERSSSGGAFTAISDYFLENGNAVVCAIYNYDSNRTEFFLVTDKKHGIRLLDRSICRAIPAISTNQL